MPDKKAQPHVMVIDTEEGTISEFLEAIEVEPHYPGPQPKRSKIEEKMVAEPSNTHRGDPIFTMWGQSEQKILADVQSYRLPLPFLLELKFTH